MSYMKTTVQAIALLIALIPFAAQATPEQDADFASRCASPGVVRCVGFDSPADVPVNPNEYPDAPAPQGVLPGPYVPPGLDATNAASGGSSLRFTIPSNSGSDVGSYWTNFSDDFSVQFGEGSPHGKEFYVQWRQKFSTAFLETNFEGGLGWKQIIIGEGDGPNKNVYSCTDLEIVVNDQNQRGFPQMYHSCGAKDSSYEPLVEPFGSYDFLLQNAIRTPPDVCGYSDPDSPACVGFESSEWMTFQVHVIIGTPYQNTGEYEHDSTIQLWVAREGQPSQLVIDYSPQDPACQAQQTSQPACQTGYDLYNDQPLTRHYGQVWLTPYHTTKSDAQAHADAYTWYDELIISTSRIPDPGVPGDTMAPAAPSGVSAQ